MKAPCCLILLLLFGPLLCHSNFLQTRWTRFLSTVSDFKRNGDADSILADFLILRVGKEQSSAIWHYSGIIRSPLSGNEFVAIEGLEFVKRLSPFDSSTQTSGQNETYISKKVFIYTEMNKRSEAMQSYRLRPLAPKRPVEPVKTYQEKVTLFSHARKTQGKESNADISMSTKNIYSANIEWPGGRILETRKLELIPRIPPDAGNFGENLFRTSEIDVVTFIRGSKKRKPISKWISFAGQSDESGRSQEHYTFSSLAAIWPTWPAKQSQATATMKYKRYGEGPAWFGAGRPCVTEITGRRYSSLQAVPDRIQQLVGQQCPQFLSRPYCGEEEFALAEDAYTRYKPWWYIVAKPFMK